jgi:hypothetical protein
MSSQCGDGVVKNGYIEATFSIKGRSILPVMLVLQSSASLPRDYFTILFHGLAQIYCIDHICKTILYT